ncbi:MAG: hypothetical protein U0175_25065 [Caldilineaceae bacterium]
MKSNFRWIIPFLLLASLLLAACGAGGEQAAEESSPATVEHLETGPDATKITLTEDAAKRIDVQTVAVSDLNGGKEKSIPYAAVLYDTEGKTWTYTMPEALTYLRSPITVDRIDGDVAILSEGPPAGQLVVTTGATELYGAEEEFEEE